MDSYTLNLLRIEPGSIGDTARSYATGFNQLAPVLVTDERLFTQVFTSILLKREKVSDDNTVAAGNKLIPVQAKGLKEVYRILNTISGQKSVVYKIDLPTMIWYAMILESDFYREGLVRMENEDVMQVLDMVYEEIYSICPHQCLGSPYEFTFLNSCLIIDFIMEADCEKYFFPIDTVKANGE